MIDEVKELLVEDAEIARLLRPRRAQGREDQP